MTCHRYQTKQTEKKRNNRKSIVLIVRHGKAPEGTWKNNSHGEKVTFLGHQTNRAKTRHPRTALIGPLDRNGRRKKSFFSAKNFMVLMRIYIPDRVLSLFHNLVFVRHRGEKSKESAGLNQHSLRGKYTHRAFHNDIWVQREEYLDVRHFSKNTFL